MYHYWGSPYYLGPYLAIGDWWLEGSTMYAIHHVGIFDHIFFTGTDKSLYYLSSLALISIYHSGTALSEDDGVGIYFAGFSFARSTDGGIFAEQPDSIGWARVFIGSSTDY